MKLIIDIPEIFYQNEKENKGYVSDLKRDIVWEAMIKGTPLDTHDEEVIAETVESIWGKPPYTELLDKIREEIKSAINYQEGEDISEYSIDVDEVLQIIDKYRNEVSK